MKKIPTPPKARGKKPRKRAEIRGDDPGVIQANSAPANFTPPDEAPRITNAHEPADFAEAELAKNGAASPLPPPHKYASWLDYAVATMDTRSLFNNLVWGREPQWPDDTSRKQMEDAARAELAQLRRDHERNQPT